MAMSLSVSGKNSPVKNDTAIRDGIRGGLLRLLKRFVKLILKKLISLFNSNSIKPSILFVPYLIISKALRAGFVASKKMKL